MFIFWKLSSFNVYRVINSIWKMALLHGEYLHKVIYCSFKLCSTDFDFLKLLLMYFLTIKRIYIFKQIQYFPFKYTALSLNFWFIKNINLLGLLIFWRTPIKYYILQNFKIKCTVIWEVKNCRVFQDDDEEKKEQTGKGRLHEESIIVI